MNGYTINAIYSDISSGISFDNKKWLWIEIMKNLI